MFQTICLASTSYTDLVHKNLLEATNGEKGFYEEKSKTLKLNPKVRAEMEKEKGTLDIAMINFFLIQEVA